ncbi:MAG: DUF4340 domain-containing protein [Desulfatiglandales bacterium]
MSYRTTLLLVIILLLLGSLVYLFPKKNSPESPLFGPEVWSVDTEKINRIEIHLPKEGQNVAFVKGSDDFWYFDEEDKSPVDKGRWAGIVLLVSGPSSRRLISQKAEDPSVYGFKKPNMEIIVTVQDHETLKVVVGDRTPNRANYYVKLSDYDPIYTVDRSWQETMKRLVKEPPRPKPE